MSHQDRFPNTKIHESAYIDDDCTIGAGSSIWHFSHIMPRAQIGERVNIGQNVVVSPDVTIGTGCKIQNNVSLYTGVHLDDYVFCGPSMVFTNILTPRCEINRRSEYVETRVGYGSSLGANSTIVCGHTIGRFVLVGAGAVVTTNVPDYALMLGVPAKRKGWACRCGLVLPSPDDQGNTTCTTCGNEYHQEGALEEARLTPVKEADPLAVASH